MVIGSYIEDNLQDLALMINCASQIADSAVDLHEHFIQMPTPLRIAAQAGPRPSLP
jgi:hypothetical protein